jgi:formate hydrogenlyase subunit 6/NADH:ubiquinone oxidoreductase subunit I
VELGYDPEQALAEASRCLGCHDNIQIDANRCVLCGGCSDVCPFGCIEMVSGTRVKGLDEPRTTLLVLDEDLCIRCGSCVRRCPTEAISMSRIQIG